MDTILVVDDDADIRETMHLILADEGFRVVSASDGEEALAVLRSGVRPRLILLDLMMPVLNGWQFREVQLSDPVLSKIPVIVISADSNLRQKMTAIGAAFLRKPLDMDQLLAAIARVSALQ
jgi:CheY-like chemotaxis protein